MDEVACGFGRTGRLFASEHFAIEPDILCLGKAITNGVLGLGAMIATPAVAKSMEKGGSFWSTYGWHPRSVAAAIATVRYMTSNRRTLMAAVKAMSTFFAERLASLPIGRNGAISVAGLAISIDLESEREAERVRSACFRRGLLLTTQGSKLLLLPPLTVDARVAQKGLDILGTSSR